MFSNQPAATREVQEPQEFHQEEIQASKYRANPAPSRAQLSRARSPQSHENRAGQCQRNHQQRSMNRAGPVSARLPRKYQSQQACAEKRVQPFFSRRHFNPNASAFNAFGGRRPAKSATTFSAAITAIFVRVSSDALAICGAKITSRRGRSAGCTSGSCS